MRPATDIAIIGMAGLFPGAKDINAYWHNILSKTYSIQEAPEAWASPYFDPTSRPGEDLARIYTRQVGLLGKLAEFNPLEFGIPPTSVDGDPSHFLSLKLARDALQDSGYLTRSFNRENTGIILGRGSNPNRGDVTGLQYGFVLDQTLDLLSQFLPELDDKTLGTIRQELIASLPTAPVEKAPTLVSNVASGRIANRLDLMGPNYLIDAACASSLIAVKLAVEELLTGRCDMMLAGGVQASMPPVIYQLFCQLNALSRGQIRPFDRTAGGTLLSEGVGFLVLKRLEDAQRDGDRIYAVVKGVGMASDGKALGMLAPRLEGEMLAIARAYQETGIDPHTIGLVEAHGTGIPLGDQTEIKALRQIFGDRQGHIPKCALGSVKSMIGHCIPASGVASLIKTSLSLYYKTLPPTLCDEVNPELGIEATPFYVNTEARPWIHTGAAPRRAGVNAFGFGGINTHAILEEYTPERSLPSATGLPINLPPAAVPQQWPTELCLLSANGREALIASIQQLQTFLAAAPETNLADLAYTLSKKESGSHRLAMMVKSIEDLQQKLERAVDKIAATQKTQLQIRGGIYYAANQTDPGQTAFLFSSEGAQYPNMLADACLYFPQIRDWFDFLDETFPRETPPSHLIFPPPTTLTPEVKQWAADQLYAGDLATEALFAASMGLYELLRDFEVNCDVVVGHSAGEHTAASAIGVSAVKSRSQMMEHLRHLNQIYRNWQTDHRIPTGVIMSVGAVEYEFVQQLIERFAGSVHLVADNCPSQLLLFATSAASEAVANQIKQVGGICVPQPFDRAYHTPLFEQVGDALKAHYDLIEINEKPQSIAFYSCATTELYPQDAPAVRMLALRQWSLPVRFRETIEKLYSQGVRTFIEVGAGSNLTAFVDDILKGQDHLAIASNNQRQTGLRAIQQLLAKLFIHGRALNLATLYKHRDVQEITLEVPVNPPKPSPTLNLLLPRMSLKPEFVEQIRAKLISANSQDSVNPHGQATPPQPPSSQPVASTGNQESRIIPAEAPDALSPRPPEVAAAIAPIPLTTSEASSVTAATYTIEQETDCAIMADYQQSHSVDTENCRRVILEGHFELMDEFLANQQRVTEMLSCYEHNQSNT
ncbi:MAG: type I polyketide synthase [Cyanobacteria bacterium J06639_14]